VEQRHYRSYAKTSKMVKARIQIAMLTVIGARAEEARLRFEQEMIAREQARMQGLNNVVGRRPLPQQPGPQ
jgi:hypothetical protein